MDYSEKLRDALISGAGALENSRNMGRSDDEAAEILRTLADKLDEPVIVSLSDEEALMAVGALKWVSDNSPAMSPVLASVIQTIARARLTAREAD